MAPTRPYSFADGRGPFTSRAHGHRARPVLHGRGPLGTLPGRAEQRADPRVPWRDRYRGDRLGPARRARAHGVRVPPSGGGRAARPLRLRARARIPARGLAGARPRAARAVSRARVRCAVRRGTGDTRHHHRMTTVRGAGASRSGAPTPAPENPPTIEPHPDTAPAP